MCSENSQSLAFPRCSVPGWPTFAPCPWKLYPLRPSTPFTCPEGSTWPPTPQRHGIYIVTVFYCSITWVPQEADSIMKVKVWESVLGINTCGREGHQDWTEGEGGLWCSPNKASADPIGSWSQVAVRGTEPLDPYPIYHWIWATWKGGLTLAKVALRQRYFLESQPAEGHLSATPAAAGG